MNCYTTISVRICLFWLLAFLLGCLQPVWSDEGPYSPDADRPAVSPNGQKIVFESDANDVNTTIWIANRDGSNAHPLVDWPDSTQTDPDWSPDGQSIVFESTRSSVTGDIWRVDADGSNPVRLTNIGENNHPRFSPDGNTILFKMRRGSYVGLMFISVDGGNLRPANLPSTITVPSWSPDGNSLVYTNCDDLPKGGSVQDMECHLYTYQFDTKVIKQLTFGNVHDSFPDWGGGGIIFHSTKSNTYGIWIIDETGANRRHLTTGRDFDMDPRWDHKTNTIVFSKTTDNTTNIWSVDTQGNETQLTHFGFTNHSPVANAGVDQTVECASQSGTSVKLNGSASSDPDGDVLSFAWSGAFGSVTGETSPVQLPLGINPVTLSVNDSKGGNSTDTVTMNVRDTLSPLASAALIPAGKIEKKEGTFRVTYNCSDSCSASTTATATLNGIAVTHNQIVKLEVDKKTETHVKKGLLNLEAPSFALTTTCTDPSLNVGTTIAAPLFDKVKVNEDREEKKIDSK